MKMNPMNVIVLIVAGLLALESVLLICLPERFKTWLSDLSPGEMRMMGVMLLLIVTAAIYYALSG